MKPSVVLSGRVSEMLSRIEQVSIFPKSYLPNYLDESRFIVDDINFLILVKILWTVVCERNKNVDLVSRNSTFFLECFLEDNEDRNKKFDEWTKAAEMLQSEIAQVTKYSLACNVREIQACVSTIKRYIGIFSNYDKRFSLLHN